MNEAGRIGKRNGNDWAYSRLFNAVRGYLLLRNASEVDSRFENGGAEMKCIQLMPVPVRIVGENFLPDLGTYPENRWSRKIILNAYQLIKTAVREHQLVAQRQILPISLKND